MLTVLWIPLAKSADQLEVQIDGTLIPVSIEELTEWGRSPTRTKSELSIWLDLLEPESREGLQKILKAPLLKELSLGRQVLRSWAGRQLLDEVSDLILVDNDDTGATLFNTIERLLEKQSEVSTLELLEELPAVNIRLDLDALFQMAHRWKVQLNSQQKLSESLAKLPSKEQPNPENVYKEQDSVLPISIPIDVTHREEVLELEVWNSRENDYRKSSWVLLMPGLGGSQNHFRWLARYLSSNGWSVVVLEHPGSDTRAVKELLEGKSAPPGAEVIPERLSDVEAVLLAKEQGQLNIKETEVVLMGHSLGALTALLAGGAMPGTNLKDKCKKALDDLSITNLSQFLQCQLNNIGLIKKEKIENLKAIVGLNSFGSLLWPNEGDAQLDVPVLFAGGTLDLITPPLSEQLGLLISTPPNPKSRVILVEGASHFSPIRVEREQGEESEDLFQLGQELVGVKPLQVQQVIANEIKIFMDDIESKPRSFFNKSVHRQVGGIRVHRLFRKTIKRLLIDQ